MKRVALLALALAALAGCGGVRSHDTGRIEGYELRLPVTPAPGGPLQRVPVPAAALAALQTPGRSDLRLFDAEGTRLPMALTTPPGGRAKIEPVTIEAMPIMGPGGGLAEGGRTTLSIEDNDGSRIVRVVRADRGSDGAVLLGALLDTRAIADPVRTVRLDGAWPARQPVRFMVEASTDLAEWAPLGSRTLYRRRDDGAGAIGDEAISLFDANLKNRYVRIRWSAPSKLLGPVEIARATLGLVKRSNGAKPTVAVDPPERVSAHELRFTVRHPIAPVAIGIDPAAGEMLVPVTISGREDPEQGWSVLGTGVVRPGSAPIALQGGGFADFRIEADARTPGFAETPAISLAFQPVQLVVLFNGKPPYTLAAGAASAENRYLGRAALIPNYRAGDEDRLPLASVAADARPRLALAASGDFSSGKAILWGLLILGVVALGVMVWRLWRSTKSSA